MEAKSIGIGDSLRYGWNVMKQHFWYFVLILIIYYGVLMVVSGLLILLQDNAAIYFIGNIIYYLFSILLGIGMMKITLALADQKKPGYGELFTSGGKYLWRTIGCYILYGLIVMGGLILFIIPGIIWAIKFSMSFYLIVDQDMGIMDSLRKSATMTQGAKWGLLGFGILAALINLLGLLVLVIGLFATIPTTMMAYVYIYRRLMGKAPMMAHAPVKQ